MSYVVIKDIVKSFNGAPVLDSLSLTVNRGEMATLLGPSGCGKTTLLRCVAGLTLPDRGLISIDGKDITGLAPRQREVGMVFQAYALFPNMTVSHNIAFGLKMKKLAGKEMENRVRNMIELVDLAGKEHFYPAELSGGQQQRVALARSLVLEPKVLLLDEPLNALDAKIRKNLQAELRRIQKGLNITMIMVTHDQEEAFGISDTVYIINKGRVEQAGGPGEVYAAPASRFVAEFIGNYNVMAPDEFRRLVRAENLADGGSFAVRPEVIKILPAGAVETFKAGGNGKDGWYVEGKIDNLTVKGNCLCYRVKCGDLLINVDQLNDRELRRFDGETPVKLWIPREECISLN